MLPMLLFILLGLFLGLILAALFLRTRAQHESPALLQLREQCSSLQTDRARYEERATRSESELTKALAELDQARLTLLDAGQKYATEQQRAKGLEEKLTTQKQDLAEMQSRFKTEFENLAQRILEEKSSKFAQQNQTNLDLLLKPFSEKLRELRQTVETTHLDESKQRASLGEQVKSLAELNQRITREAQNLTQALKGQSQTQGAWGEFILESVLERSGLTKGTEYSVQNSYTTEEQQRVRPDVVINLPESKNLVIDSKLSLLEYERYCSAATEPERELACAAHVESLRRHLRDLSEKKYQTLYQINSPDFVLMFVPIESAFSLALQHDAELFNTAFERNIVLVTPTTLLATLRTVSNLWKMEKQNKNSQEIARKAGELLDKFADFYTSLEEVGKRLSQTQIAHEEAMKRLKDGRGNLVNRAREIEKLGAKATKALPSGVQELIGE